MLKLDSGSGELVLGTKCQGQMGVRCSEKILVEVQYYGRRHKYR